MSARSLALLSLAAALCVALLTYSPGRDPPVGAGNGAEAFAPADALRPSAEERYMDIDEVPAGGTVNEDIPHGSGDRRSVIDDGQVLTPVTSIAPLAQILRDLVISDAAELPQVQSASLVESLDEQERAFAAESVDSRWATTTETEILGSISRLANLQLITLQVDCKMSTCRLQLAERAGHRDFIARSGIEARWILSRVDQHGTRITVAYVARDDRRHRDAILRRSAPL